MIAKPCLPKREGVASAAAMDVHVNQFGWRRSFERCDSITVPLSEGKMEVFVRDDELLVVRSSGGLGEIVYSEIVERAQGLNGERGSARLADDLASKETT